MRKLHYLLDTLESHRLDVVLVPLNPTKRGWNEHGCKRVVADRNVGWYRTLCASHISKRGTRRGKPDTIIRRRETLAALNRLIAGKDRGTIYGRRILEILPLIKL